MQAKHNPTEFYQLLCATFPNASIFVVVQNGSCINDFKGNFHQFAPVATYTGMKEATGIRINGKQWIKIGLPFSEQYQFLVFFPEGAFRDNFIPARMIDTLYRIFTNKALAPNTQQQNVRSIYNLFLYQLFNCRTPSDVTYTSLLATKLGFDLSSPRIVCLISWEEKDREVSGENIDQMLGRNADTQDIHGEYGTKMLVYCPYIDLSHYRRKDWKNRLLTLREKTEKRYHISLFFGVGLFVHSLGEYDTSIHSARIALGHADSLNPICFALDYLIDHMLQEIPEGALGHFLGAKSRLLMNNPILAETAQALVDKGMDILQTANALSVHRNTIVYRIGQIKELLGLNPLHKDNDRFTMILVYHYAHMHQASP